MLQQEESRSIKQIAETRRRTEKLRKVMQIGESAVIEKQCIKQEEALRIDKLKSIF